MKIGLGADHAGYHCKEVVKKLLENKGIDIKDFGTYTADSVDYPDYVHPLAASFQNKEIDMGLLFCGSGNGVAMAANKHQHIRAALCWNEEITKLARQHNDANVLCVPARFVEENVALKIVETFLSTTFEGGRHSTRVNKISNHK